MKVLAFCTAVFLLSAYVALSGCSLIVPLPNRYQVLTVIPETRSAIIFDSGTGYFHVSDVPLPDAILPLGPNQRKQEVQNGRRIGS